MKKQLVLTFKELQRNGNSNGSQKSLNSIGNVIIITAVARGVKEIVPKSIITKIVRIVDYTPLKDATT